MMKESHAEPEEPINVRGGGAAASE
jgi:hypothetical protein